MQDKWNKDYIKRKADDYRREYGIENVTKLADFYDYFSLDLAHILSHFHHKINYLVKELQSFLIYECSEEDLKDALQLFVLTVKEISDTKTNLDNSSYSFQMDTEFHKTITLASKVIVENSYNFIPDGFNEIIVIENRPLFSPQSTITVSQFNNPKIKLIGQGSYAQVFRYKDPYYNRNFVLKRALKELNEQELERFKIEFSVMKELRSPHVVEVYRYDEEKHEYIMEHVNETLHKFHQQNNGSMTFHQRKDFVSQILNAFQYIHSKNIMHRDISTTNILVKKYEDSIFLKVSDFGLVKRENSNLTNLHTALKGCFNDRELEEIGFSNYQMHHETYALTKLIYFIMTGRTVISSFKSNEFKAFVSRGLSKNVSERYASVDELGSEFMKIVHTLKEVPVR